MKYDILITSVPHMDKDKPAPGPAFIKAYLEREGFSVMVIDGNRIEEPTSIIEEIDKYDFKWLGISVFSYEQEKIALTIGNMYDNVVYGGPGVHLNWQTENYIVGEGEYALLEFLKGNLDYPGINGSPPEQIKDVDSLPAPDYTDCLNKFDYDTVVISGSRGCVRNCTFCDVASIWPNFRFIEGTKLADNMIDLYKQTNIDHIQFSDSLVNGSMKQFRSMVKRLAERPEKITWSGQFIVRNEKAFTEEDFNNLLMSGCGGLTVGIESGSESVRYHMKKKFSNNDIDYYVKNIAERGIPLKLLLIVGYPTETEKDFQETLSLFARYKNYAENIKISPHMMFIEKNTPIDLLHRELFSDYGFEWENELSNFDIRYERFLKVFDEAKKQGYSFKKHALDKIKIFDKHINKVPGNAFNSIAIEASAL